MRMVSVLLIAAFTVADRGASRRKSVPRVVTVRNSVAEGATKTSAAKTGDRQKAIVVGGGVGGLGMASRLAHAGYDVTILEKNEDTGGRARSEFFGPDADASGWRFDTGPSLMLLPDRYREQFTAVGKKLEDYMDIERVDPAYRAHFGDHTSLDLLYDTEKMRKQLDEVEFGAGGRYIDWLGRARASLDYGVAAFIERDANSILDFVDLSRVGPLALAVNPLDLLLPQFQQMKKYFKSPKLRALFSYQELYVGLSPYNAPGVFSLLAATELTDGVWYPKGGFDKVRGSLQALCDEEGVEIRTGTSVESIVTEPLGGSPSAIAGSKATQVVKGVKLASGEMIEADVVVANPDLPCVWDQMIDKEVFPEAKKEAELIEWPISWLSISRISRWVMAVIQLSRTTSMSASWKSWIGMLPSSRGFISGNVASFSASDRCTSSQSRPRTSTSSRSARRCLRMTRVAASRPDSDNLRSRSSLTASNPSRSIRATVWDTVGPEWPKRSAIRALMDSSSRTSSITTSPPTRAFSSSGVPSATRWPS